MGELMYYSSGNYEAFARPKKPEGIDHKSAYIIGTGLAALSAACYLGCYAGLTLALAALLLMWMKKRGGAIFTAL